MVTALERWKVLEDLDGWLRTPMLVLGAVWLLIVLVKLTYGSNDFLTALGTLIWIVFIAEFAVRIIIAPDKARFLRRNWLTAIALTVPALRLVRAFAIFRAARALRGFRLVHIVGTANRSMNALRATMRRRKFGYLLLLTLAGLSAGRRRDAQL
jgi:voltage-gated potassium channel